MIVLYKNATVEKQYSSLYADEWRYPEQVKKKLHALNQYIACAESLRDLINWLPFHLNNDELKIRLGWSHYFVSMNACDTSGNELTAGDDISTIMITEVSNHYE